MNTYCISDIHGEHAMFTEALKWVIRDAGNEDARLILLGDYVDRGPDSRKVVNAVRNLVAGTLGFLPTVALQGNHEDMMTRAVLDGDLMWQQNWVLNGGLDALTSYEVEGYPGELDRPALEDDARFLRSLPLFHEDEERIYVHAGLSAGVPLAEQHPMDLLWMRTKEFDKELAGWDFGKLVVHGHTPRDYGDGFFRQGIDGGACFERGQLLIAKFTQGRLDAEMQAIGRPQAKKEKAA